MVQLYAYDVNFSSYMYVSHLQLFIQEVTELTAGKIPSVEPHTFRCSQLSSTTRL